MIAVGIRSGNGAGPCQRRHHDAIAEDEVAEGYGHKQREVTGGHALRGSGVADIPSAAGPKEDSSYRDRAGVASETRLMSVSTS
jgi:hypothetical protein